MYSLLNFPYQTQTNVDIKLTPRSREAFNLTGYCIEDIKIKTADQINLKYNDNMTDPAFIDIRVSHHEEKRK